MSVNPIVFNNTVLRDGHQSLAATRMRTEQMLPVVELLDGVGFGALETWGGATIDSCLRFLGENPFDRLDALKRLSPKTPHMMLLRGQNIVQYTSFPDDVVSAFVKCSAEHGMDIFRIFDALNDIRNLKTAFRAVKEAGKHAQGVICYTTSPVHTVETFIKLGEELEAIGSDSVCIKDMAGLISPSMSYELVKSLKQRLKVPVVLHTHSTAGMGAASYYAAIEAGVDEVDTSIAPFANGTGQPDTLLMQKMLEQSPRKPSYDVEKLHQLREHFDGVYEELSDFTSPRNERVDSDILIYQVPGGMLSNFRNQLKEQGMADRLEEVMREIPYVREQLGWIPLVTPTSQIVGTQAMLNVKFGRWKMLSQPAMDILLGKYGRTPGRVDAERRKQAERQANQEAIECRPADVLEPRLPALKAELAARQFPDADEVAVLHAMFPQELKKILTRASAPVTPTVTPGKENPAKRSAAVSGTVSRYRLMINGTPYGVSVETLD
ncbi:MAG: Methylmalonyl-CoA carboxyltransferase 5S subunit [Verrucomicrobia subdivision 3 bacterium]|nr:Methylmalonyl-CoA carboxyltransferase 5S subunit [Limisphaerales bacterium]MCS1413335.1 Methylmalonyl-CoA carboxyltransferase 5S subunit [Limisphaerales bacterium]